MYAFMYIIFAINSFFGLIWCTNPTACEKFVDIGSFSYLVILINRWIMFVLYMLIVALELLVVIKLGLG